MKKRYTIYLSTNVADRFDAVARVLGAKSALVEKALDRQLDPDRIQRHDEALLRRMDGVVKGFAEVQRDVAIATETLSLYVRYFLTITPPVPKIDQEAARALGRERFRVFVAQVGRRLAGDHRLITEVLESIVATNPDLLADAIDDGLVKSRSPGAEIRPFEAKPTSASNGQAPTPLQEEDYHG
jgi:hypothetical protein